MFVFVLQKEKQQKDTPVNDESNEEFSGNRKRRITRVKVRKKDKGESKQSEDPKRQKMELKGPRVKHVCRSASIVLGQPIATFPTHEEKEKQDKSLQSDDNSNSMLVNDKDRITSDLSSCDSELDTENKPLQIVPEVVVAKENQDQETLMESKKRKIDSLVTLKPQNKNDSSEDETVMDLVPRKTTLKPLTNITNVCS